MGLSPITPWMKAGRNAVTAIPMLPIDALIALASTTIRLRHISSGKIGSRARLSCSNSRTNEITALTSSNASVLAGKVAARVSAYIRKKVASAISSEPR